MFQPIIQSGPVEGVPDLSENTEINEVQHENIQFEEAPVTNIDDFSGQFDPSFDENGDSTAGLGKYLERPVKIHSFTWAETDTFTTTPVNFDPWKEYFDNSYIKNKLQNYSRLRCKLHLTFRFNASPFYYGSLRANYDPLKSGKFAPIEYRDLVPISQTPGVYIEPQEGTVAEMVLPFLYYWDWVDTSQASNLAHLGNIFFEVYSQLRSANGVTGTGITVSTYARAIDVEVAGPTVAAVLQSGIISGPASAVAIAASNYEKHPKIGPYAKAIKVGATLVSSVARMFGFSNDPVMDDVAPVQNKAYHAFANTETRVPVDKLALDPQNQVTLDNRVAGIDPDDELEIARIVQHESYVAKRAWTDTVAAGTALWYGCVSPFMDETYISGNETRHHMTPLGWVSQMFRFWRGGIRYRFKVVRSKYQKGRLMISWDPNGSLTTTGNETALFTKIFDLESPDQDFEFVIPYKAVSSWLACLPVSWIVSESPVSYSTFKTNGTWQISVVNALTGPAASNTVDILMYASATENFEFAAPKVLPQYSPLQIQSGVVDGRPLQDVGHVADFTVGERVKSLRVLLHRTALSTKQLLGQMSLQTVAPGDRVHVSNYYNNLPPVVGFSTNGFNTAYGGAVPGTAKRGNFGKVHPINWVLCAFAGYRGSVTVHAVTETNGKVENLNGLSVTRMNHSPLVSTGSDQRNSDWWMTVADESLAAIPYSLMIDNAMAGVPSIPSGNGGMTLTHGRTQMGLSANIPQYCPGRFWPAWHTQRNYFDSFGNTYDGFRVDADFMISEESTGTKINGPTVALYWAAGVDFNTVFFTGVPRLHEYEMLAYAP